MRFVFLREDGLVLGPCLVFAGNVSLLLLLSKDKVKVELIVRTNLKCLLCQLKQKVNAQGFQGRVPSI